MTVPFTYLHPGTDEINKHQKFGCQAGVNETHYVIWHSECPRCVAHLKRIMTHPGMFFMTHGATYRAPRPVSPGTDETP